MSNPLGKKFRGYIQNAIARTEAFLVIIDDEWLNKKTPAGLRLIEQEKDNCRLELHQALMRVRSAEAIELLPIIEGSLPHPKREDFPDQLGEIIEFNCLRWDHDNYELCVQKVVDWVSDSLGLNRDDVETHRTSSWGPLVSVGLESETEPVVELAVFEPPVPPATEIDSQQADASANVLLLAIRSSSRNRIVEHRVRLERWNEDHGDDADQSIRCKVLTLLAETEFHLAAEAHSDGEPFETPLIRERIERAEATKNVLVDSDTQDRLLCLTARVDFIDGRKSEALESLGSRITPLPFKFRLIMLQELGRLAEANGLLEGMEPSSRWTDVAIPIRFMSDHEDRAEELLEWTISNGDEIAAHHCRLAMARCLHTKALQRFKGTGKISPAKLTPQELDQLGEVLKPLEALIQPAISRGRPENGLEIDALEIAVQVAHLRLDRETAGSLANVLALARPASIQAAQAFLWGYLPYSAELVANLRADHQKSFDANFFAMTMEFDSGMVPDTLREKITALWSLARDTDDKEQLAGFLIHFIPGLPEELKPTVIEPLEQAMGLDHDLVRLVKARHMFHGGHADDAKKFAEDHKTSNPEWELLLADIAESKKEDAAALGHLLKAAETVTHPDLFWRAAIAASRARDWPKTIELLEIVLKLAPDRLKARRQLFQACMRVGSEATMRLAQEQLKLLEAAEPNVLEHVLNQAIVCVQLQEFPKAISLFDELLNRSSPEKPEDARVRLSATLHRARIVSTNNPAEAFSALSADPVRNEFREQIAFWQGYMQFAHRAGQDAAAHDAMEQILRLEDGLSDDQKSLWPVEIEELKEMLLARGTFMRELRRMVASSRCTMSFLAMEENRPLVQEMIHRSQPMIVPETEEHHGRFVTYASNGIVFFPGRSGFYEPQDLKCAPPDSNIVIDPTSIVTLHRLGLLQTALARFSQVRVPAHLISKFIDVVEKLEPHQRSSREATIEAERLLIAAQIATTTASLNSWIVEFDGESSSGRVGIRHVIDWLNQNGHLGEDAYKQLQPLHFDTSGTVHQLTAAIAAGPVGATSLALTTLARHQLLETFVARATIVVSEETRQEISQAAKSYREFEGLRLEYERMIEQLRAAPNVVFDGFTALASDGDSREDEINRRLEEAALSVRLAKEHAENLLVDDRVCQQMLAHERGAVPLTTFSCWHLVEALYDEKQITMPQLAAACVKLMQWRYRFFIPRADVLLYFAHQYRASCPGQPLRDVAMYMMDCFADSGLPCGLEPTSPPFTLSARLFHRWMTISVDFIVGVWRSTGFSLDQKKQFVSWALTNVAPVPAAHAAPQEQTGLAHVGRQLILSSVLVRLPANPIADCPSAVLLELIRETLSISELEYFRTLGTTLTNMLSDQDEADDAKTRGLAAFLQRMAEHAVGADNGSAGAEFHVSHFGIGLLMSVGSFDGNEPNIPCEFSEEQLAAIASKEHILHKSDHGTGPLCFVWKSLDKESVETVDVATRLGHALGTVREAACDYFRALSSHAGSLLSEFSNKLFVELEPRIRSSDAAQWYPAATAAIDTFERDFLLNLAGFAQSLPLPADLQRVRNTFANRVFNPPEHPAKHIARENFDDLASAEVWQKRVESCVVADDLKQSIWNHLQRF